MMALDVEQLGQIRDLLGARAWDALRLGELAQAAGVTRATLARRGITKRTLRDDLADLLSAECDTAAAAGLALRASAPDRLWLALMSVCIVEEQYLGLIDALGERLGAIHRGRGVEAAHNCPPVTETLRRILRDGRREGSLEPGSDLDATATLLFNATVWTYRQIRIDHGWGPEKTRRLVVGQLTRGVRRQTRQT